MLSLAKSFADTSLETTNSPPTPAQTPNRWTRAPISLMKREVYSRLVVFDGKKEPHVEPHFDFTADSKGRDPDFDALIQARWFEYLAEGYLKTSESKIAGSSSTADETRANEPVQLYLAHRRVARAKLELRIYNRLLRRELGPLLRERFEDITKQSLPPTGLFADPLEVSPV